MNESLRVWAESNQPEAEMIWHDAFWGQVNFMRNYVAALFARNGDEYRNLVRVVNTHNSKSIRCPVYYIHLEREGVKIWARDNFYNWNVTVESDTPIDCDFLGVVDDRNYSYCFCEGMEDSKGEKHSDNKKHFTVDLSNSYEAYVFFRVLKQHFKIVPEEK
jgi:hypothetical protein